MGKVVEIDCEKSMKLETSRNVTKSKRSLHWCRSISKKYLCRFYYSISQKVITLSGRRFITVSGGFITLSGVFYYIIGHVLQYRAFITLSVGTGRANQCTILLQNYLNKIAEWEFMWQMQCNIDKCFILRVSRSKHKLHSSQSKFICETT